MTVKVTATDSVPASIGTSDANAASMRTARPRGTTPAPGTSSIDSHGRFNPWRGRASLPRPVVLALGVLAAAGGLVCHVRHREPVQGWSLLALLVVLVLLASPLMLAMDTPLLRFDAVATWWPKVQEVASGQAPTLDPATAEGLHVHPEYPRGSAWPSPTASTTSTAPTCSPIWTCPASRARTRP